MYIDIFLGVFILIGLIQGYYRGVVRTLFTILGILVGLIAALKFSPYVIMLLERVFSLGTRFSLIAGMLITFLGFMWGIQWIGRSFEQSLRLVRLNIFNRLAGAVIFTLLMVVSYAAILWFVNEANMLSEKQKDNSRSYPLLEQVPTRTGVYIEKLKPVFREFWEKMEKMAAEVER